MKLQNIKKVECYQIQEEGLRSLYEMLRTFKISATFSVTVLHESTLISRVKHLLKYNVAVEIIFPNEITAWLYPTHLE